MKATTKRALAAAAFGLALAAGSLGLGAGEAHARYERPIKLGPCTQYDLNCKHSVIEERDDAAASETTGVRAEPVIARMCLYCVR